MTCRTTPRLDISLSAGAIPARHRAAVETDALDDYSAMASGTLVADDHHRHGEPEPSVTCR
ncbi:hypothetical protein [Streptomyces sp. NBC_01794]|uniref:hypothetical protein n=1 Tax=Streptomyces sp. NBC_01794 TaxID=2975942 RepID=UPI0030872B90|nr:hypothetical protein OIE54_03200 [Streptomyces sp. NBC_01794]